MNLQPPVAAIPIDEVRLDRLAEVAVKVGLRLERGQDLLTAVGVVVGDRREALGLVQRLPKRVPPRLRPRRERSHPPKACPRLDFAVDAPCCGPTSLRANRVKLPGSIGPQDPISSVACAPSIAPEP